MTERRFQTRLEDRELAIVCSGTGGINLEQLGNVEDLSLTGAGIIVDHALSPGTAVRITYGEGDLTGIVRHCAPLNEGHFIGVEFVGSSRGFNT